MEEREFSASPVRDFVLKIHTGMVWTGRMISAPVVACLNFFDKTTWFSGNLKKMREEDDRHVRNLPHCSCRIQS